MKTEKKTWFSGISRTFWMPISIEGWSVMGTVAFALYLIFKTNDVSNDIPFVFSQYWPALAELAILVIVFYWEPRDHVDKKY